MKKSLAFAVVTAIILIVFSGCGNTEEQLEQRCKDLRAEISALETQKEAIESEILNTKIENGTAKYVVTFKIKQSHFTLDIGEHIKDSMNEITLDVSVDKEYFDAVSIGDTINRDFRMGSLIMHGSFGNWKVTVCDKQIK
ncbi:hypothetical protein AALD01_02410 [Oscillospiraceae bacterium 21-37]